MEQKLLKIINQVLENSGLDLLDNLTDQTSLRDDLQLDSISMAELIASVDIAFNADINAGEMVETLGDIKNKISK